MQSETISHAKQSVTNSLTPNETGIFETLETRGPW